MRPAPLIPTRAAALLLFVLAVGWSWLMAPYLSLAVESYFWPRTSGKISDSKRVVDRRKLAAAILYDYEVSGAHYSGSNFDSFGGPYRGPEKNKLVGQYPTGSMVQVSYSRNDPSKSMIMPGMSYRHLIILCSGVFLWVMAALFWREANRERHNRRANLNPN